MPSWDLIRRALAVRGPVQIGPTNFVIYSGTAVPTDGSSGTLAGVAGPGSFFVETTTGAWYRNTGTLAAPQWEPGGGGAGGGGALEVRNESGAQLDVGDLVYVSGWNETEAKFLVTLADADAQGRRAEYVVREVLANTTNGIVHKTHRGTLRDGGGTLDLAGRAVGDPVFLSTAVGDATVTDPTDADPNGISQIVARVAVVATDIVEVAIFDPVQVGTSELQDGAVTRAKMAQEALVAYKLPLAGALGADGAVLGVAEDATDLFRAIGSNLVTLKGRTPETATEAAEVWFQFRMPAEYEADADVRVIVTAQYINGAGVDAGRASFIDVEFYRQVAGATAGDINATAAIVFSSDDTYETFTFTITDATLIAGDIVNIRLIASAVSDDANPTQIEIGEVSLALDIKG